MPSYFFPEVVASDYLSRNRNEAFAKAGFEMLVYTPTPCRGITDEEREDYKRNKREEKLYDGMMAVSRFSLMKEGKGALGRAMRYTIQCLKQFWFGAFSKEARSCDVIFISSTPPIQGAMAAMVKKFNKKPIVYNLQDIFPDSLVGTGLAKKGSLLWKIGRVIEDFTYRNADKIVVISEDFKRNIMAKGVPEKKIEVIYNWVDEQAVVPVRKEDNPLYNELGIAQDKFTIVYAGNLGNAQNVDIILDAAKLMQNNVGIQFVLFGTGGREDDYKKRIHEENLHNVQLFPLQSYERVSYVYGLGDVCVVSCKVGLGGSAMPSKTWSIMSSGRAILANFDEGELKDIIEKEQCGIFTKAGDTKGVTQAILSLYADKEHCVQLGRNGREFIMKNLTKAAGTGKYVEVIKSFA